MMNGEIPKANIESTILRSSLIYRLSKGKEARLEKRKLNTHMALQACDRIVASAAPFTPISNQKMKIGSNTIFNKAPIKTEHIAIDGRPCALIKAFKPVDISTNRVPSK
jgi:hypothetical protein